MKRLVAIVFGVVVLALVFLWLGPLYIGPGTPVDGDTLREGTHKFRLRGIRTAESGTENWKSNKDFLQFQVLNRGWIACWHTGDAVDDALVAFCYLGPMDIGAEMIRQGRACAAFDPRYRVERYIELEKQVGKRPADCGYGS